jgi:hypothetical protein
MLIAVASPIIDNANKNRTYQPQEPFASLSAGPRYLRNFEQAYKGGPSKGLFLILTAEPASDLQIPGAGYTLGQLQVALALNDFESLELRRMLVMQLHFTQGLEQGLSELEHLVQKL